jgi:hypothetical protein
VQARIDLHFLVAILTFATASLSLRLSLSFPSATLALIERAITHLFSPITTTFG